MYPTANCVTTSPKRRALLKALASGALTAPLLVRAEQKIIRVDARGVRTVEGLVKAMKRAAGKLLPDSIPMEKYYQAFAKAVVDNYQRALAAGVSVPGAVQKLMKQRNWKILPAAVPLLVTIPFMGLLFTLPLADFFIIIFASILLMGEFIDTESKRQHKEEAQPAPPTT